MKLDMRKDEYKGRLITFCGLDGCGKTTQIRRLVSKLESDGYRVYLTKQPTDFVRESEIFRTYMDSSTQDGFDYRALSLLCASDRIQHSNKVVAQKLEEGYIVISDRYFYSCLANLIARGFENDMWIYEIAMHIPKPDLAFFLNVPVEEAIRRVRSRLDEKNRYIDIPLQQKLHDLYISIARENDGVIISTLLSEDACFKRIIFEVDGVLHKNQEGK